MSKQGNDDERFGIIIEQHIHGLDNFTVFDVDYMF